MEAGEMKVTELKVQRDAIVALTGAHGVRVECREGSLWITIDRDLRDVVLAAGECFEYEGDRRVLVMALAACSVRISFSSSPSCARPAAARASPRRRFFWERPQAQPRIALI